MLEYCIREDLKLKRPRMMAVLDPIKLIIDNYPEGETEYLDVDNNLENPELSLIHISLGPWEASCLAPGQWKNWPGSLGWI